MSEIKSQIVKITESDENIYHFISDFTNFEQLMPPSPLTEAFKKWEETTKQINEERKKNER